MPDFDLRQLTLGAAFKPKTLDIATPAAFTAQGAPDDLLRLVGMSATERIALIGGFGQDTALNSAILICATLCYRDSGGPQGLGTPVYAMTDTNAFVAQDFTLLDALAMQVKQFLGIGEAAAQVDAAKNDSGATPSNDGGSESPPTSDTPPSEDANQ